VFLIASQTDQFRSIYNQVLVDKFSTTRESGDFQPVLKSKALAESSGFNNKFKGCLELVADNYAFKLSKTLQNLVRSEQTVTVSSLPMRFDATGLQQIANSIER
jgi:hypothetical protein